MQSRFEPVRIIDEKHGVVYVVFLTELSEKYFGQSSCVGGKKPDMEKFVCGRIDSGVQPVLLVIDANHALVKRNLIRSFTAVWL